jgi:hypothetical protein
LILKSCFIAAVLVTLVWQAAHSRFAVGYWIERLGANHVPRDIAPLIGPRIPRAALRRIGTPAVSRCIAGLSSADWRRRAGAADALRLYGAAATPAIPALIEAIRGPFDDPHCPWKTPQTLVRDVATKTLLQIETGHPIARQLLTAVLAEALPAETEPLVVTDLFSNRARWNDRARRVWAAYALAQLDPGNAEAMDVLATSLMYEDTAFRAIRRERFKGPGAEDSGAFAVHGGPGYYYNREMDVRGAASEALMKLTFEAAWRTPVDPSIRLHLLNGLVEHATEPMSPSVDATNQRISALIVIAKMGPSARGVAAALMPLLGMPGEALVSQVRTTLKAICPQSDGTSCPPP